MATQAKLTTKPLQRRLADALEKELRGLVPGTQLPSVRALSERFACAPKTMMRTIALLEAQHLVVRMPRRGIFTAQCAIRKIFFLTPCPAHVYPFDAQPFNDAERAARACGIVVEPVPISQINSETVIDWNALRQIPCGAPVIVSSTWYHAVFDFLNERRCRVVFYDSEVEWEHVFAARIVDWHRIEMRCRNRIKAAVAYLAGKGCKNILFIHGCSHEAYPSWHEFRRALRQHGLRYASRLALYTDPERKNAGVQVKFFSALAYKVDGVLALSVGQAWAAWDWLDHALPMAVTNARLPTGKLPHGCAAFDGNSRAAGEIAVQILLRDKGVPERVEVPYTSTAS